METLTISAVLNGYRNKGTLVIFNETHKDGDFKGKQIVYWSNNPDYRLSTKKGWTYDPENDRVIAPVVTDEDVDERKIAFAHSLGIEVRL
jgi:hypothetical protein